MLRRARFHASRRRRKQTQPGSSPRRQRPAAPLFRPRCAGTSTGVIAACARTNRLSMSFWWCAMSGHPRVCEEQGSPACRACRTRGSSLRVRGAGLSLRARPEGGHVIPACAGSSSTLRPRAWASRCHPCVCGEQCPSPSQSPSLSVSSLRVRGAESCEARVGGGVRVIPACAGSRISRPSTSRRLTCHPCVCGEQNFGKFHS